MPSGSSETRRKGHRRPPAAVTPGPGVPASGSSEKASPGVSLVRVQGSCHRERVKGGQTPDWPERVFPRGRGVVLPRDGDRGVMAPESQGRLWNLFSPSAGLAGVLFLLPFSVAQGTRAPGQPWLRHPGKATPKGRQPPGPSGARPCRAGLESSRLRSGEGDPPAAVPAAEFQGVRDQCPSHSPPAFTQNQGHGPQRARSHLVKISVYPISREGDSLGSLPGPSSNRSGSHAVPHCSSRRSSGGAAGPGPDVVAPP